VSLSLDLGPESASFAIAHDALRNGKSILYMGVLLEQGKEAAMTV